MKLSVIIVNYNVRYFLEQCIRAARKALTDFDGEIIVIDNASVDGSDEMMRRLFPEISYKYLAQNVGFSKANNIGIESSTAEYVLLLNPDTVVAEDAFRKCIGFMDANPDAGGLGVHMIDGSGRFLPESKRGLPTPRTAFYKIFGLSALFPKSRIFGNYHLGFLDKEFTHSVEILSGAYMMMRKAALAKSGLLDEAFFMYGEDIDLSYRLIKAGYKNYYFPEARIIHYKGESTRKGSVNYVFVFYRAMVIFAKKHFDKGLASLFGIFIETAIYFRALLAIARRIIGHVWQAILDGVLIFSIFLASTHWYGAFASKQFDLPFIKTEILAFALLSIVVLSYSGVYDRGFRFGKLFRAWFFTVLLLLGFYALLPESYRFSRAVLLIGSSGSMLAGVAWRLIFNAISPHWFDISKNKGQRIAVAGDGDSLQRIKDFLEKHKLLPELIVGLTTGASKHYPVGYVGQMDDLGQAIEDFRLNEVIFDVQSMHNGTMIRLMEKLNRSGVQFRMAVGEPLFIVGSQESIGEDYTISGGLLKTVNIQAVRRLKRTFDLILCALFIPLFPIVLMLVDHKGGFVRNFFKVLIGAASWVGYDPRGKHVGLPSLKSGVCYELQNVILPPGADQQLVDGNVRYVSNYTMLQDLNTVTRQVHSLGNAPC